MTDPRTTATARIRESDRLIAERAVAVRRAQHDRADQQRDQGTGGEAFSRPYHPGPAIVALGADRARLVSLAPIAPTIHESTDSRDLDRSRDARLPSTNDVVASVKRGAAKLSIAGKAGGKDSLLGKALIHGAHHSRQRADDLIDRAIYGLVAPIAYDTAVIHATVERTSKGGVRVRLVPGNALPASLCEESDSPTCMGQGLSATMLGALRVPVDGRARLDEGRTGSARVSGGYLPGVDETPPAPGTSGVDGLHAAGSASKRDRARSWDRARQGERAHAATLGVVVARARDTRAQQILIDSTARAHKLARGKQKQKLRARLHYLRAELSEYGSL